MTAVWHVCTGVSDEFKFVLNIRTGFKGHGDHAFWTDKTR